jgi:MFS transporter, OFA family, oxalate/formate antiporter
MATGLVFSAVIPNAVKWFPTEPGKALGFTVFLFNPLCATVVGPTIEFYGYEAAFQFFGTVQGVAICTAFFLRFPSNHTGSAQEQRVHLWDILDQLLRSSAFWRVYVMFVFVASGGLVLASQLAPLVRDLELEQTDFFGFGSV